ncbi:UNVERIFIED_CONTAM: hypothetical protein FKN15_057716 [Acipenser sinensis]
MAAVVINYLAAEMGMPPQVRFPLGGATPTPPPQAVGTSTPGPRGELHQSPATEGEPHQSPMIEGDCLLLPPPLPGGDYQQLPSSLLVDYLLFLPPLLEGDCLLLLPPPLEGDCLPPLPPPLEGAYLHRRHRPKLGNVENYWASVKKQFKTMQGIAEDMIPSYLDTFKRYGRNCQDEFINVQHQITQLRRVWVQWQQAGTLKNGQTGSNGNKTSFNPKVSFKRDPNLL